MILILIFVIIGSVFLYIQTHKISNNTIPKSLRQFAKELHSDNDHIPFHDPNSEPRNFCEPIHIGIVCSGFNSNVHLHALLKSLLMTRSNPIHLHILVSNDSATVLRLLFKSWHIPQVNVSFYNISKWLKDVRWVPNGHYSGNYGLLKLIFHKVIPASVTKKLLILDTDLIIVDDIHMLWKLFDEFNYQQAIGIAENQSPYYLGHLNQPQPWPAIGVGFNSGVMLYDLEKLNAMKWELVWTNLTKKYTLIYGQTDLGDQDILNSIIKQLPNIVYKLPCYWNIQMSSHSSGNSCYSQFKPKILHWNSPQKYAISTRDGDMFRGVAQSVFEFNGNWFRNYPQLCGEDTQIEINIESADECDKFSKASNTFYRTLLFFLDYNFIADDWDITYVTHLSFDRIHLLENIAKIWTGPISFTLYVSDAELVKSMRLITESEVLNRRSDIAYHAVFQQGEFYPINTLRNVGLKHVKTPYSFLVDVDFTPMKSLFEMLRDNIRSMADLNKKALIVPAFEPVNPDVVLPKSKIQLIDSLNRNEVRPFRADVWARGHAPTNYDKWRKEYEPYHVKWQPHYEPYVVVKSNVPRYDERFLGFGWNKVSHIMELEAQNYDFIVLSDVFIIHASHALSWDNAKFKQSPPYRRCNQQLKKRFIKELTAKYNKNFSDVNYSDGFMKDRKRRNTQEKIESTTSLFESTDFFLTWGGKEKAEGKKERKKNFPIQSVVKDKPHEVSKVEYYYYYDSDDPYNLTISKLNKTLLEQLKMGNKKETDLSSSEEHNYEYDEDDLKFKELHDSTTLQYDSETFPSVKDLLPVEKQDSVNEVIDEKLKNAPTDGR
ncbi:xylosyl- and glucuronyltransferase LARGE2s-like [Euwallacea similis]|uniref:xylosyl- and glucuronyltransferase LARGE2s-like n=1 Tax=Euwallacea similis TaxID=1736056 RepID=UPI00344B3D16